MTPLEELASLLKQHEATAQAIAALIKQPAHRGQIGEFIAAQIFAIDLAQQGNHKGSDGVFRSGSLAGRSVNIKFYSANDRLLDVNTTNAPPDFYLVLTGPHAAGSAAAKPLFALNQVYLFEHAMLLYSLNGLAVGVATSIRKALWEAAEVYPHATNPLLIPTGDQQRQLQLFRTSGGTL